MVRELACGIKISLEAIPDICFTVPFGRITALSHGEGVGQP